MGGDARSEITLSPLAELTRLRAADATRGLAEGVG